MDPSGYEKAFIVYRETIVNRIITKYSGIEHDPIELKIILCGVKCILNVMYTASSRRQGVCLQKGVLISYLENEFGQDYNMNTIIDKIYSELTPGVTNVFVYK